MIDLDKDLDKEYEKLARSIIEVAKIRFDDELIEEIIKDG